MRNNVPATVERVFFMMGFPQRITATLLEEWKSKRNCVICESKNKIRKRAAFAKRPLCGTHVSEYKKCGTWLSTLRWRADREAAGARITYQKRLTAFAMVYPDKAMKIAKLRNDTAGLAAVRAYVENVKQFPERMMFR